MRSSSRLALGALRHGRVLQVLRTRFWASTTDTEGPGDHQGGLAQRRVSQGLKRPHSSHLSLLTSHSSRVFSTVFPTCPDLGSSSSWLSLPRFVHLWAPTAGGCWARCQERWRKGKERKERGQRGRCFPCRLRITPEPTILPVKDAAPPIQARGVSSPLRPHAQPFHGDLAHGSPSRRLGAPRGKSSPPAPG